MEEDGEAVLARAVREARTDFDVLVWSGGRSDDKDGGDDRDVLGAGSVGTPAPEKPPVSGPGAAVAKAFTPVRAGLGGFTVVAAFANLTYDEKVLPDAGAFMALYRYEVAQQG